MERKLAPTFYTPTADATVLPMQSFQKKYSCLIFIFVVQAVFVACVLGSPRSYGGTVIENRFLEVELKGDAGDFTVQDKRTGYVWSQVVPANRSVKRVEVEVSGRRSLRAAVRGVGGLEYTLTMTLQDDSPELLVELAGDAMPEYLNFPYPFCPEANADFLLALKSGLLMPVTDDTVFFKSNRRGRYAYYEGHNASMPFYGLINPGGDGLMRLVETPNDAGYRLARHDGRLVNQVWWRSQFDKMGYARRVRYVLFDKGGYVAMANRFRDYARQQGMVKTLREKAKENPNVDKLIGAANLWLQDFGRTHASCLPVAREMVRLGMSRMIFNGRSSWHNNMSPEDVKGVNALGYLSGRYDIYQDVFDLSKLDKVHANPCWVPEAWPHDVVVTKDGSFLKGWNVTDKTGNKQYCNRVTEVNRTKYARKRISEELFGPSKSSDSIYNRKMRPSRPDSASFSAMEGLTTDATVNKKKPYLARLMDTEAASAWEEDWHPDRMMTRTQCRAGRMELLRYVKDEAGLVTGAEGLQCFAVPYVDYFEGVGPIEPFRRTKADGEHPFTNFEPDFEFDPDFAELLKISHRYQVPLWDLVFHDCAVTYPRWDEADNKFPNDLWVKKGNLQKILYGRPPIFNFTSEYWQKPENQKLVTGIYKTVCPVARQTGYARMIDHQFLTPDRDVQRTVFDNGITVTVNFGDQVYRDSVVGELGRWEYKMQE